MLHLLPGHPRGAMRAALLLVAALLAAGCSDDEPQAVDPSRAPQKNAHFHEVIEVDQSGFKPTHARVLVGGNVTFVNRDPDHTNYHSAESDGLFKSTASYNEPTAFQTHSLTWNEPYTIPFHKPGTYKYLCTFHSDMTGIIAVLTRTPKPVNQ